MAKTSKRLLTVLLVVLLTSLIFIPVQAQDEDDQPVVRAILFYSPACPHCEDVIQDSLPPLLDQYGEQLKIIAIDTSKPVGQELYQAAIAYYQIPQDRLGVPTLIVNDTVMVGGGEIPAQFPGIIGDRLLNGGTEWPEIPGLAAVVAGVQFNANRSNTQSDQMSDSAIDEDSSPMMVKFLLDPVGNSISVIVLVGMIASVIWVMISFTRPLPEKDFWPKWVIPVLSVLGLGVAFYLTYVETSGVEAVCGPVGDCNTVQLSPYALLFGVLPVGLLGLIGYVMILAGWAFSHYGPTSIRWASAIAVWGMTFFGVLFSIYLTFLEPFVIGATCMWCISSAIFQTIIFLAATDPAKRAWQEDDFDDDVYLDVVEGIEMGKNPADIQEHIPEPGTESTVDSEESEI